MPEIARKKVDLPEPDGPVNSVASPGLQRKAVRLKDAPPWAVPARDYGW